MKPKSIPSLHYEYILFKPLTMLIDMSERQYLFIIMLEYFGVSWLFIHLNKGYEITCKTVFMHSDVMSDPVIAPKPGMASVTKLPNASAS